MLVAKPYYFQRFFIILVVAVTFWISADHARILNHSSRLHGSPHSIVRWSVFRVIGAEAGKSF